MFALVSEWGIRDIAPDVIAASQFDGRQAEKYEWSPLILGSFANLQAGIMRGSDNSQSPAFVLIYNSCVYLSTHTRQQQVAYPYSTAKGRQSSVFPIPQARPLPTDQGNEFVVVRSYCGAVLADSRADWLFPLEHRPGAANVPSPMRAVGNVIGSA